MKTTYYIKKHRIFVKKRRINKRKQCGKDSTKKLLFARLCLIFLKKNKNLKFKSSVILIIF